MKPDGQFKVEPGESGKIVVRLLGLQPIRSQLRLSLGQGIDLKLSDFRPLKRRLGADMILAYAVRNDAKKGPRDLHVQQGVSRFAISPTVFVVP